MDFQLSIVHFNGYSVKDLPDSGGKYGDWQLVCWGNAKNGLMGRIPTAIKVALQSNSSLLIWSTGATKTDDGLYESEHAYNFAKRAYDGLSNDFPTQFQGILPANNEKFVEWLSKISTVDTSSTDTRTAMEVAVPLINDALDGRPGTIYVVTSPNHAPRAMRDALATWTRGVVVEGAPSDANQPHPWHVRNAAYGPIRNSHLVTICAVASGTSYGHHDVSDTRVDDLGKEKI